MTNIVASEDPGGNLNFRTNINAQQSTRKKAMICKRNKFINSTNETLVLLIINGLGLKISATF